MAYSRFSITFAVFAILTSLRLVRAQQRPNRPNANVDADDDEEILFKFVTRPDIGAPKWNITLYDQEALAPGYWFLAPYANLAQTTFPLWNGAHIYDQQGGLIWSGAPQFEHKNIHDFRVQTVNGEPMLTANFPFSLTRGYGAIMDHGYNVIKKVDSVGTNYAPNMHDFNLIDDGKSVLMLTTEEAEETEVDLPWFKGKCNVKWQGFKEVDVESGSYNFEWNDKGHISLNESNFLGAKSFASFQDACTREWDMTHFNSIDKFPDGDYLLSSRHTDALYKISAKDGSIVWRLGGERSDFVFNDPRAEFSRQHHSRVRGQNDTHVLITVFDNAVGTGRDEEKDMRTKTSWGLYLSLRTDTQPMTVDLITRYEHPKWRYNLVSQSRGSVQILDNGNAFVGWVWQSLHSEHAADGTLLMSADLLDHSMATYRSYKYEWVGRPEQPPDVHSAAMKRFPDDKSLTTVVHVSWNGATEVATWNLLHSNHDGQFTEFIDSSPRQGFETKFEYEGFAKHVICVALDINGNELGRSNVKMTRLPPEYQSVEVAFGEMQWVENAKNAASPLSNFGYFTLGIVFCIAAICIGIVVILRRRAVLTQRGTFGWLSRRPKYDTVAASDEDELEQKEWMLSEEESRDDR